MQILIFSLEFNVFRQFYQQQCLIIKFNDLSDDQNCPNTASNIAENGVQLIYFSDICFLQGTSSDPPLGQNFIVENFPSLIKFVNFVTLQNFALVVKILHILRPDINLYIVDDYFCYSHLVTPGVRV
jgi:hypothetical protein